jgi:ADP-L-glycero-D-manno-heptose 6-epimerase
MDLPVAIDYIDMPESIRNTYQYHTCAETEKIRQTGYTAATLSLEAAVNDYIRNYLIPNKHLGDE